MDSLGEKTMADMSVDFENLICKAGVSCVLEQVATNPILKGDNREQGLSHYRCHLARSGKEQDVYVSVRQDEGPLGLMDVFFLLALDACGCDMMGGVGKFRDKWETIFGTTKTQPKEIQLFWQEYEKRCEQSDRLKEFLGEGIYKELIRLFQLDDNG